MGRKDENMPSSVRHIHLLCIYQSVSLPSLIDVRSADGHPLIYYIFNYSSLDTTRNCSYSHTKVQF